MVVNIHYMIPDICAFLLLPDITVCAPLYAICDCRIGDL